MDIRRDSFQRFIPAMIVHVREGLPYLHPHDGTVDHISSPISKATPCSLVGHPFESHITALSLELPFNAEKFGLPLASCKNLRGFSASIPNQHPPSRVNRSVGPSG